MNIGWGISGGLHFLMIVLVVAGLPWGRPEREEVTRVTEVTLIDASQFLAPREAAPEIASAAVDAFAAPTFDPNVGETPDIDIAPVETEQDFVEDPSAQDRAADLSALLEALAQPDVAVEVDAPDEASADPVQALAMPDMGGLDRTNQAPRAPSLSRPPAPVQAPRIAGTDSPKPPKPPKPEASDQDAVAENQAEAEETRPDEAEQSVEEESASAISPEEASGEEDGRALKRASAPRIRTREDVQKYVDIVAAEEQRRAEAEDAARAQRDAEAAAIAAATEQAAQEAAEAAAQVAEGPDPDQSAQPGPPLTPGEKDALRLSIQRCWSVPAGLQGAEDLRVVLAVELGVDGRIVGQPRLIEPANSDRREVRVAFEAARRALLRCQGGGYDLPREKYEQWKNLEVGFNPEGMLERW